LIMKTVVCIIEETLTSCTEWKSLLIFLFLLFVYLN
jgi:hypothetical protein